MKTSPKAWKLSYQDLGTNEKVDETSGFTSQLYTISTKIDIGLRSIVKYTKVD